MRRRFSLNALVVAIAAMSALVLTVTRRSPDGVVSYTIEPAPVRAAPGAKPSVKHDLSALKIFNLTLVRIKENYVDSKRIDPERMRAVRCNRGERASNPSCLLCGSARRW